MRSQSREFTNSRQVLDCHGHLPVHPFSSIGLRMPNLLVPAWQLLCLPGGTSMIPRMIHTAPMAVGPQEEPVPVLLYCPEDGGWRIGVWLRGRYSDGVWCRQGWRLAANHAVELRPTKWLPHSFPP